MAARHFRDVLLPLLAEGEDEEMAHQRLILTQRDGRTATQAGEIAVALLYLLVEVGHRGHLHQLVTVEPAMQPALVFLVQPLADVDGAHYPAARSPVGNQLA